MKLEYNRTPESPGSDLFGESLGFRVKALIGRFSGGEPEYALGASLDRLLDEIPRINGCGGRQRDSFVWFHGCKHTFGFGRNRSNRLLEWAS